MVIAHGVSIAVAVFQLSQDIGCLFELLAHLLAAEALILDPLHAFLLDFKELAVQSVTLTLRLTHHVLLFVQISHWDRGKVAFKSILQKLLLSLRLCNLQGIAQGLRWMLLGSNLL